ncbi:hypothetical protein H5410_016358 [Solanum commersonii]|uniref:Uncharacterized protein n=1 Tax=Solanum commersonii TaxID=4109 RepID=A0A9J5ZW68_SOLCO|nr:hypothetical protein H5410_016358 [Solanum commersonii]
MMLFQSPTVNIRFTPIPIAFILPSLFPSTSLFLPTGRRSNALCNLNTYPSIHLIGFDQTLWYDSRHKEPSCFDGASQPLPFPDEIDNNDKKIIVVLPLRPVRPIGALRFWGAIEDKS